MDLGFLIQDMVFEIKFTPLFCGLFTTAKSYVLSYAISLPSLASAKVTVDVYSLLVSAAS